MAASIANLRRALREVSRPLTDPSRDAGVGFRRASAFAGLISGLNALVLVAYAWDVGSNLVLTIWGGASLLLFAAAQRIAARIRIDLGGPPEARDGRAMRLYGLTMAAPWAAFIALYLRTGTPELDTVILTVAAGMTAGGAVTLQRTQPAAICYFGTILGAAAFFCLLRDGGALGVIAFYCVALGLVLSFMTGQAAAVAREREALIRQTREALGDLTRANEEISRLARQDVVTGLPNRKAFAERIDALLARHRRDETPFAVLFIDLDRFKTVNDTLGHDMGDRLLRRVGETLQAMIGDGGLVARLGGDEFAVALDGAACAQDVGALGDHLVAALARPQRIKDATLHCGASLGAALCPQHGRDARDLMRHADMALAEAKIAGRGRMAVFDHRMAGRIQTTERIERQLRDALEKGELEVHYQPQFDLATQALTGAEALLRWRGPGGAPISPATVFAVAEERGLVTAVSDAVFDRAARDLAAWIEDGLDPPRLALNVHALDLRSPQTLIERLERAYDAGAPGPLLRLEITEGCVVGRGSDQAVAVLERIAAGGVTLSLDDFGTGHASLIHLRNLPVSELKIDRGFIAGLSNSRDDRAIVSAALEIAAALEIECVAEGVETEEQRRALMRLARGGGALRGQGWLWAQAMDAERFTEWLRRYRFGAGAQQIGAG